MSSRLGRGLDALFGGLDDEPEEIINKPKKYCYEVILNPDTNEQTIIGYDTNGEKEFWLYPEGKESGN